MNVSLFNKDGQIRERIAPRWIAPALLAAFSLGIALQIVTIILLALSLGG